MNTLARALGLTDFDVRRGKDALARSGAGMDAGAKLSPGLDPRSASPSGEAGALHGAAPCPAGAPFYVRRCALHGGGAFRFFSRGAHRWHALVSDQNASRFTGEADARAAAHEHGLQDFTYYIRREGEDNHDH